MKKALYLILGNVLVFLLLAAVVEGLLFLLFLVPFRPQILLAARDYHLGYERLNPMYLPQCAQYDGYVTYRLRPEGCRFESREFSTAIRSNKLGLRDDEESREAPEIIVAGDSHAFGWGVEEEEAFPQLLEKLTGKKVLNASLPSFGTVRELRMFKRADRSAVKDLIIQYSENDREETASFVAADNRLAIMSSDAYDDYAPRYREANRRYYPGKFIRRFLPAVVLRFRERNGKYLEPRDYRKEARNFLQVLLHSPASLENVRVWVTEITAFNENSHEFIAVLREEYEKLSPEEKSEFREFHTIDLSPLFTSEHYFVYDDHLTPAGHRVAAEAIAAALAKETGQ